MTEKEIQRAKELMKLYGIAFDTATELAEAIAEMMKLPDELDDECSPIWDLAVDYIEKRDT